MILSPIRQACARSDASRYRDRFTIVPAALAMMPDSSGPFAGQRELTEMRRSLRSGLPAL